MGRSVEVLLRGGLLLAGVLALGLLLLAARLLYQRWQRHAPREPFSLRDLEAMRDTGQLSRRSSPACGARRWAWTSGRKKAKACQGRVENRPMEQKARRRKTLRAKTRSSYEFESNRRRVGAR